MWHTLWNTLSSLVSLSLSIVVLPVFLLVFYSFFSVYILRFLCLKDRILSEAGRRLQMVSFSIYNHSLCILSLSDLHSNIPSSCCVESSLSSWSVHSDIHLNVNSVGSNVHVYMANTLWDTSNPNSEVHSDEDAVSFCIAFYGGCIQMCKQMCMPPFFFFSDESIMIRARKHWK